MFTWVNSEKGPKLDYAGNALPDCVVFSVKQHNLHLKLKVFWFGGVIGSGQSTGHTLAQHVNGMTWWVNSPVLRDTGHWNNIPTVTSDSSGRDKYSKIYLHQIRILYIDLQRHALLKKTWHLWPSGFSRKYPLHFPPSEGFQIEPLSHPLPHEINLLLQVWFVRWPIPAEFLMTLQEIVRKIFWHCKLCQYNGSSDIKKSRYWTASLRYVFLSMKPCSWLGQQLCPRIRVEKFSFEHWSKVTLQEVQSLVSNFAS